MVARHRHDGVGLGYMDHRGILREPVILIDNPPVQDVVARFQAGESTLIDVVIDGAAPIKALISDVQPDPVSGRPIHADLHQVNMKEKINANVEMAGEV